MKSESINIRYIYLSVILLLISLFVLQSYWVYTNYEIRKADFEERVNNALEVLSQEFVKNQMDFYMDSAFNQLLMNIEQNHPNARLEKLRIVHYRTTDTLKGISIKRKLPSTDRINDSPSSINSTIQIRPYMGAVYTFEEMETMIPFIDSVLRKALHEQEIFLDYDFALFNQNSKNAFLLSDSSRINTFEYDFEKRIGTLKLFNVGIRINDSVMYYLQSLFKIISISILVTLSIAVLIYYLLRTIQKQKQLSEMKNDFISNMTHEFKTPLATVSLALESIKNFGVRDQPEKLDEYLTIGMGELNRVSMMIEKVLNLAKEKPYHLNKKQVVLSDFIQGIVRQMKPHIDQQNGEVHIDVINELPTVAIDEFHMGNAISNLIDNSLKYKRERPVIQITLKADQESVYIYFRDNGIGIPEAYFSAVFENFFRVPRGNVHDVKGFGVGLSYVLAIVKAHGGSIDVKSKVDQFTEFIIRLPVQSE